MNKIKEEHIKVLSEPNRLAILSMLSMREMTTTQISKLLKISIQNAQYHVKKLLSAELIYLTKEEVVGNLVEKYYRSNFEPGMVSEAADETTIDIAERMELVFAAMGAIKGILNRGIRVLDEREDYFMDIEQRPRYPFGANYVVVPNTPESAQEAEELVSELDKGMSRLAEGHPEDKEEKFALLYSLFPYE